MKIFFVYHTSKTEGNEKYNIVMVGIRCVGKTSILTRFSKDTFSEEWLPTIGEDLQTVKINDGIN